MEQCSTRFSSCQDVWKQCSLLNCCCSQALGLHDPFVQAPDYEHKGISRFCSIPMSPCKMHQASACMLAQADAHAMLNLNRNCPVVCADMIKKLHGLYAASWQDLAENWGLSAVGCSESSTCRQTAASTALHDVVQYCKWSVLP